MNRKITIITVVILCIAALGGGIYFAWQKTRVVFVPPSSPSQNSVGGQSIAPAGSNNTASGAGDAQTANGSKLNAVSDGAVYAYWIFNSNSSGVSAATSTTASSTQKIQGSGVFYLGKDGLIYRANADGADNSLTSNPIENFQSFEPSFDGKRVIFKYGELAAPKFIVYNTEENIFESLPAGITAVAFSPDAKKIVYLAPNSKDVSKSDLITKSLVDLKQKPLTLSSIYQTDLNLQWVSQNKILLASPASAFYAASVWAFDISKKILNLLVAEKQGLDIDWSPDGKTGFMFSTTLEGRNRVLNLITDAGEIKAKFEFTTLPKKCFVSDPKIYCAVPRSIPQIVALPDDYLKNAIYFADSIYQIDINQNSFDLIFDGSGNSIDAINLELEESRLFFINKYDNRVYALDLQ